LAASKGVVLAAERFGKHKTISQIIAIIALLVTDARNEWPSSLQNLFEGWSAAFTEIALWLTVALTAASGLIYLWRNREIYLSDL
jgi:phosphatidylglycerophosphate synthase